MEKSSKNFPTERSASNKGGARTRNVLILMVNKAPGGRTKVVEAVGRAGAWDAWKPTKINGIQDSSETLTGIGTSVASTATGKWESEELIQISSGRAPSTSWSICSAGFASSLRCKEEMEPLLMHHLKSSNPNNRNSKPRTKWRNSSPLSLPSERILLLWILISPRL